MCISGEWKHSQVGLWAGMVAQTPNQLNCPSRCQRVSSFLVDYVYLPIQQVGEIHGLAKKADKKIYIC